MASGSRNQPRSFVANAGDEAQVKRGGDLERFARDRRLSGFRSLLATPSGRELASNLIADCHVTTPVFDPDPLVMAKNAGQQEWGLELLRDMNEADQDAVIRMHHEAFARERNHAGPTKTVDTAAEESADAS